MVHRIDGASATVALPAAGAVVGTPGYFTEGNPGTGTPATIVTQAWANMVQEEMVSVVAAANVTPAKGDNAQVLAALRIIAGPNKNYFVVSTTLTPPVGKTRCKLRVYGGGGSGGTTQNAGSAGSGGGAGGYAEGIYTISSAQAVTIGAGGAVNGTAGGNGNPGGTTSVGALISATGGGGGIGATGVVASSGPAGGTGSGGTLVNLAGTGGGFGLLYDTAAYGGGIGGAAFLGSSPQPSVSITSANGTAGIFPGGGGNGGAVGGAGGAGAVGLVIAEWFA